jgi:polyphosphate kinase
VFKRLRREMETEGILIATRSKLTGRDLKFLEDHFLRNVFPVLSPLASDPAHPFPFIPNMGLVMVLGVLVARRVLMARVLVRVMAASDGEPSVQCPSVRPCDGEPDWGGNCSSKHI